MLRHNNTATLIEPRQRGRLLFLAVLITMFLMARASISNADTLAPPNKTASDDAGDNNTAIDEAPTTAPIPSPPATSIALGGVGESCRARSDCQTELKCIQQECVDERVGQSCQVTQDCGGHLRCIKQVCTTKLLLTQTAAGSDPQAVATAKAAATDEPSEPWSSFRYNDGDIHPFVGLGVGLGAGIGIGSFASGPPVFSAQIPVQGGVVLGMHELSLEIAPFFLAPNAVIFQANVSYAAFIPIDEHFSYPLRAGVGLGTAGAGALLQTRLDVLGFAYDYGHLRVDVRLPSLRFFTDTGEFHYLALQAGSTVSYAF